MKYFIKKSKWVVEYDNLHEFNTSNKQKFN